MKLFFKNRFKNILSILIVIIFLSCNISNSSSRKKIKADSSDHKIDIDKYKISIDILETSAIELSKILKIKNYSNSVFNIPNLNLEIQNKIYGYLGFFEEKEKIFPPLSEFPLISPLLNYIAVGYKTRYIIADLNNKNKNITPRNPSSLSVYGIVKPKLIDSVEKSVFTRINVVEKLALYLNENCTNACKNMFKFLPLKILINFYYLKKTSDNLQQDELILINIIGTFSMFNILKTFLDNRIISSLSLSWDKRLTAIVFNSKTNQDISDSAYTCAAYTTLSLCQSDYIASRALYRFLQILLSPFLVHIQSLPINKNSFIKEINKAWYKSSNKNEIVLIDNIERKIIKKIEWDKSIRKVLIFDLGQLVILEKNGTYCVLDIANDTKRYVTENIGYAAAQHQILSSFRNYIIIIDKLSKTIIISDVISNKIIYRAKLSDNITLPRFSASGRRMVTLEHDGCYLNENHDLLNTEN